MGHHVQACDGGFNGHSGLTREGSRLLGQGGIAGTGWMGQEQGNRFRNGLLVIMMVLSRVHYGMLTPG